MLSKLTLGTAQFGLEYGINNHAGKPDIDKSIEMLEYAYLNGVKSIDTAVAYGDSETVIGNWIKSYKHDDLFITTKISSITNAKIAESEIAEYIEKQVYSSLEKLGVNRLDNLMVHNFYDLVEHGNIIAETLSKFKGEGVVSNIGCSIYDLESLDIFSKYSFDTIQLPGSIFNQSILESDKLIRIKERNVKIFVRSAFVQGLIFMNQQKLPLALSEMKDYLVELNNLASNYKFTIIEIALNYLLKHENVDSVVFGVDSISQLKEIIEIIENHRIDREDIVNKFSRIPKELVDPRNWRI